VVFEKDLGAKTAVLAKAMKEYNRNASWHEVEKMPEQSASKQKTN
jgi:hypothetical protein